jgi:hypothetical protein
MFNDLIDRMNVIPIEEEDLHHIFSVDVSGQPATLEEFIVQSAPPVVLASFGIRPATATATALARGHVPIKSVRALNDKEIIPVVEAYLDSMPEDEMLEIVGQGSYTVDDLRREVRLCTSVGDRIAEIVRQHNIFLEEAIKRGKVQRKDEDEGIELPAFDF